MKCLRCGYCCINHWVVIVDNPALGIVEGNAIEKKSGERCKHLRGNTPGKYSCAVHNEKWYKKIPCFQHGQIERSSEDVCRIGNYLLNQQKHE